MMMKNALRSAIIAGAILLAAAAPGRAQLSQSSVDNDIQTQLQSCGNGCNTAATLRALLDIMVQATFQSQGPNGLASSGTPSVGQVQVATGATGVAWGSTVPSWNTSALNNVPMVPSSGISAEVFGEFRFEDNGYLGVQLAIISNQGTGYGDTLTGTMSPASGCPTPPVISVTTNSSGQIVTVNNGGVPNPLGVCDNGLSFPSTSTPWTVISGLSAGTGAAFQLVPLAFSGVGGHCASGSTRVMATDLVGEVGPRFYLECSGGFVFGPGDGTVDTSMVRCGIGILCINGSTILNSLIADTPTPTVSAGQIGFGNTIVSPGSGTCPSGTIGGQTVQGCNTISVGGTARNYPFF